jgi:hypothetical protein
MRPRLRIGVDSDEEKLYLVSETNYILWVNRTVRGEVRAYGASLALIGENGERRNFVLDHDDLAVESRGVPVSDE